MAQFDAQATWQPGYIPNSEPGINAGGEGYLPFGLDPVTGQARDPNTTSKGFIGSTNTGNGTNTMSGGQKRVLDSLSNTLYYQMGQPNAVYEGPGVPGSNQLQQQAISGAQNMGQNVANPQQAINSQLNAGANPEEVQNYYQNAVFNPAMQNFKNTMRDIGSAYGDTYGTNGGMLRGMGSAANDFNTNLSGQLAGLQFDERNSAFDRQNQGIQNAFGQQTSYNQGLQSQMDVGGMQRAIQAQENQGEAAKWEAKQGYNDPWLQSLGGAVLGTQAKAPEAPKPSTLSEITGLIGGIGQTVGSLYGMG